MSRTSTTFTCTAPETCTPQIGLLYDRRVAPDPQHAPGFGHSPRECATCPANAVNLRLLPAGGSAVLCAAPVASTAMCAGSPPPGMLSRVLLAGPPAMLSRVCLNACLKDMLLGILRRKRQAGSASLHDIACSGRASGSAATEANNFITRVLSVKRARRPGTTYSKPGRSAFSARLNDAVLRRLDARLGRARAIWNSCASMSSCSMG